MYTYIIYYTYLPESRSNTRGGGRPSCQEAWGSVAPDLLVTRCHPIILQSTLTLGRNTDFTMFLLVDSGLFRLAKSVDVWIWEIWCPRTIAHHHKTAERQNAGFLVKLSGANSLWAFNWWPQNLQNTQTQKYNSTKTHNNTDTVPKTLKVSYLHAKFVDFYQWRSMNDESVPRPTPWPLHVITQGSLTAPSLFTLLSETPDSLIVGNHEENSRTKDHFCHVGNIAKVPWYH